ncbi:MAG: oxygen-dependent coproporphyrinogen oxidase [Candidatus Pacebacteria bacterium]|nr:oxygen-dependent coproporphyrinogen oxidase [Candidatus Paceibacterota bacterium]
MIDSLHPPVPPAPAIDYHDPVTLAAIDWFAALRNRLCAAFEGQEDLYDSPQPAGRFEFKPWLRTEEDGSAGGGGVIAIMRGRVFAKVGVNISTVYGRFSPEFAAQIPGAESDPRFFAAGISLVAHPLSPKVPIAHFNTRLVRTSRSWFGGGGDLTPIFALADDTADFHNAFKSACDSHNPDYYPKFKKWCDDYFYIKHRQEARGVGGIFFDYLNNGDESRDLEFVKSVGEAFLQIYPEIIARHRDQDWTAEDVKKQTLKRSRYVEFNLLYDRGTAFGLKTGGNVEAILMSLPPMAGWE